MADAAVMVPQATTAQLIRQAGIMVAIAASVALGVYVVLWARTPNYTVLFSSLGDRDVAAVMDTLQSLDIPYRVSHDNGTILVAAGKEHEARLKLASAGLPKSAGMGFELMQEEQGFGTSQFMEQARYQRAIEGEIARTITKFKNVSSARVQLAIPKQSVFTRDRREPSAAVFIELFPGRKLEPAQVDAVSHLVSASVANLSTGGVTIVDQRGNLLSEQDAGDQFALTAKQFDYTRKLEANYIKRIQDILTPLVGHDGVQAQVTATLDFTATEEYSDRWNPAQQAIRSEKTFEEERIGSSGSASGVPGALSNQPPGEAVAPETIPAVEGELPADPNAQPRNRRVENTTNYEIDRTVSHVRPSQSSLRRLSTAVVVRNPVPSGAANANPEDGASGGFTAQELERITNLVKEAFGFDEARGDTVSVVNADFLAPPVPEPLPEPPIWKQPWVWDIGKQALGGLFVLFLLFGVLRPVFKSLMRKPENTPGALAMADGQPVLASPGAGAAALPGGHPRMAGMPLEPAALIGPSELDNDVEQVKSYVAQDPKVAAQVVKNWVGED